jgi:serine/threonine-protein kinase
MADQFIGEVLADKYRIDSVIRDGGNGSLGKLYRGTHLLMDKPVAVKILSPALAVDEAIVRQFSAEVRTLSRLSHPNIPSVTDYGQDKNRAVFIVTEQGDGESLKNAIRREGQFSPERANRVTQQIASALSAAHANGVLHGNLTSENIFLSKTADGADFVKVLDFGASQADEHGVFDNVKTVEYLAPERFSDSDDAADTRSDIYSLGVILYEMLAGEVPFTGENATDVMLKHAQEPPLPLSAFRSDLPNEIEMIVQRALAKVPENRYQSAGDLADALNRATVFATRLSAGAPVVAAAALADDRPQNNLWKTAFIVLAGIAVLSGFFIYMTQVKQTNPQTTLQTDANGSPVQPVNPATGMTEQGLSNMGAYNPLEDANINGGMTQDIPPAGGGYGNPWDRSTNPPPGAPVQQYIPPTGQYIDGNINPNSPFMAPDGNIYIPVPKNTNTNVATTQPKPRTSPTQPAAANTQTAPTNTRPAANTVTEPKTTTTPRQTPKPEQPKTDKPTSSGKVEES